MAKMNSTALAKLDNERLFGDGVDIFKSYHAVLSIYNILKNIGVTTSNDSDWFRAVAQFAKIEEISALYDKILSPARREEIGKSRFRTPPELDDEDPDDIISYLNKNIVYRRKMWKMLTEIYENRVAEYKALFEKEDRKRSALELRFNELQELFELSDLETRALVVVFISESRFCEMGDYDLNRFRNNEKVSALASALGILDIEAAELLNDNNNIRKYGLTDNDLDLDRTFLSYLAGISSTPLADRFWTKYEGEVLPWNFHGRLAEQNGAVLKTMIGAKTADSGLSVLLYGVPGSGKTSFAASLAADMGKTLYFIAQNDNDSRRMSYSANFRYAALAVAQKQLDPEKVLLVVDECDKMVENSSLGGGFLSMLFGGDLAGARDGESKGQLNTVMDQNRHTILWICNSRQEAIDPSSRRRFDYNIFFDELSSVSRIHIWENALQFNGCEGQVSKEFLDCVSRRYPVNPGGIAVAVKNAAITCRSNAELKLEEEILVYLKAHCQLLGIQESPDELLDPARDYSLDGLNIKSGIKLPRLIDVCRNFLKKDISKENRDQPRLNLLLFGVPGSGKTEFVKYLAKQLDKKLCVKNAADLLNKYVGGTEQRITAAFAEAELEDSILFIDEADGMLSSRDGAVRNFEVSQVNTLLTAMERFRGIFICSTNLIQRLDNAALRRFSFRLHFDYLTDEGKEIFFRTYFSKPMALPELDGKEKARLFAIDQMTPSDFRNVRQQFYYLEDNELSNSEIIEALETEIQSRTSGSSYRGLGNVVQKMGF